MVTKQKGTRAGAGLGLFVVVAIRPRDVRLVQVKAGTKYLSTVERERIVALTVPANVSRECWRFRRQPLYVQTRFVFTDQCRTPVIERRS